MILTAAINGGLAVLSARELGPSGRGVLVLIITTAAFTAILCSLGVNTAARYRLASPRHRIDLPHYLSLAVLLTCAQAVLCATVTYFSLGTVGSSTPGWTILLAGIFGGAVLAALLSREATNAFGYIAAASLFGAVGNAISAGGTVLVIALDAQSVGTFVAALAVGSGCEVAAHLTYLRSRGHRIHPQWNARIAGQLIRLGVPALGLSAGQSVTFRLDRYLMGFMLGPAAVGIYSVAATASELLRLLPAAFGQVAFFRTASESLSARQLTRARRVLLAVMCVPIAVLFWAAPFLLGTVFGNAFEAGATAMRILLLAELAIMSFQIDTRVLSGLGATREAGAAGMIGLGSVAVLDLLLIPKYGMNGAAWASVVAYVMMGVSARALLRRRQVARSHDG